MREARSHSSSVNSLKGIGKPEPLRENLAGFWSRRIDETNRLVYAVDNKYSVSLPSEVQPMSVQQRFRGCFCTSRASKTLYLAVISCRYHYSD
ncbi:MAG: type II toxin-antitoxin system YoeB family toxin [Leptolyngbyaceae cyanobacterium SL_1_1]|nr:type II toxin-antitoxin system YoeB family toxin [Leptolyngbyaceae cyanobacterium RM1_1_2]NJO11861.1 type II toxin-antitoxin system YoeB family toxin [Leptolyngbyaceae cyanobacterium SL_1_1]